MQVATEKLSDFIQRNKITASVEWADTNPNMASDEEWMRQANHYKITLRCQRHTFTTYFSQGCGITREPSASDLLNCLASDAAGFANAQSFEDWCSEYGYDTDSRKAEKTYNVIQKQAEHLERFLPDGEYERLLWHTELD